MAQAGQRAGKSGETWTQEGRSGRVDKTAVPRVGVCCVVTGVSKVRQKHTQTSADTDEGQSSNNKSSVQKSRNQSK